MRHHEQPTHRAVAWSLTFTHVHSRSLVATRGDKGHHAMSRCMPHAVCARAATRFGGRSMAPAACEAADEGLVLFSRHGTTFFFVWWARARRSRALMSVTVNYRDKSEWPTSAPL